MKCNFIQKGNAIDYLNNGTADIAAGDIVTLKTRIGIAGTDIKKGAVGTVTLSGVFSMPKVTGEVDLGAKLYIDPATGKVTTASQTTPETGSAVDNVPAGWATKAALSADETVNVKIG